MVIYTAGRKHDSAYDIPSMGKFEAGDGQIGWDRSVAPRPKLRPHSAVSKLMEPEPGEVIGWSAASLNMETVAEHSAAVEIKQVHQ